MAEDDLKNDAYWLDKLSVEEFKICRQKGTEPAFSGEFNDFKQQGQFRCRCCQAELFNSEHKYDSGSGWPSFYRPQAEGLVSEHVDQSHAMTRTEICCQRCGSHLGHVFSDGPAPTGLRYCVNSASLCFKAG